MRRIIWVWFLLVPLTVVAQQRVSSSVKVAELQEAPSSSLDLLKNANKDKTISVATPVSQKTTTTPSTGTVSAPAQTQNQNAPAAKTTPTKEEKSVPSTVNANILDIPMEVGTSSSVQATVKPVAPKKTPAPAKNKTAEKNTKEQNKTAAPADTTNKSAPTDAALPSEGENPDVVAESEEEAAADAELEYAVRLLERSKKEAADGRSIPPSAAKNKTATVPSPTKKFNPNAFRPNVEWIVSKSNHFDIYTQKSTNGQIGSSNMAMAFEESYQTLRRFIPWMMSQRVRVFVYQDHNSYLKYEPNAKAWTRALAYPTRGEIVVYDEPGKMQELKEVFSHELTHIFTQSFFDKHHTGRIMTPTWLDEGLAVLVEDQAYSGSKGGPWNHDYKTLNIQRDPREMPAQFGSTSMFGSGFQSRSNGMNSRNGFGKRGRPVYLQAFEPFMQEGSLEEAEGRNQTQQWYLQAYLMVRFLLNPAGGSSPSNRMQFEQFTRLMSEGEAVRDPNTGFLLKDAKGKTVYKPYDAQKALSRAYRYNTIAAFEESFWRWMK